jgi:hypothetical protein
MAEWLGANGRIAKKADMAGKQADRFVKMARWTKLQGNRIIAWLYSQDAGRQDGRMAG